MLGLKQEKRMMRLQFLVLFLVLFLIRTEAVNYSLSIPNPLRTSSSPQIFYFISDLLGSSPAPTLICTLADLSGQPVITSHVSISAGSQASGSLTLVLPASVSAGKYLLMAELKISSETVFQNQTEVDVVAGGGLLLLETDRAVYKPGQTVKIRALSFGQDLLPKPSSITIEIMDPKGYKVGKYQEESDEYGYSEVEFPLSVEPNLGEWTVTASSPDSSGSQKTFKADKYVLPKFDVTLSFDKAYVTAGMNSISGQISATYSYGKPVHGTANITLYRRGYFASPILPTAVLEDPGNDGGGIPQGRKRLPSNDEIPTSEPSPSESPENPEPSGTSGPSAPSEIPVATQPSLEGVGDAPSPGRPISEEDYRPPQDYFFEALGAITLDITGAASFTFSGLADKITSGGQFFVQATVLEAETMVSGNVSVDLPYLWRDTSYVVSDVVFKPGLPLSFVFESFVGTDPVDETVHVVFTFSEGTEGMNQTQVHQTIQTVNGRQGVEVQVPEGTTSICLDIEDLLCSKRFSMAHALHGFYLSLVSPFNPKASYDVGEEIAFTISSTESMAPSQAFPVIFHVITPRGVIQSGIITDGNELKIQTNPSMAPSSRLVIFTLHEGEILADFADFQVSSFFENEVSAEYDLPEGGAEVRPASSIGLQISSSPFSRVGLVTVDKSVIILAGPSAIQSEDVGDYLTERSPLSTVSPTYSWGDTSIGSGDIFSSSGLVILSNMEAPKRISFDFPMPQEGGNPPVMASESPGSSPAPSAAPVRSFFPETWIWTTTLTDATGKASIQSKVPDSITSWSLFSFSISKEKGLGIGPVRELPVTKPFFISLDLPYSAILGEVLPLKVVLYNYASSSLQITVSLSPSSSPSSSQQGFEILSAPESTTVTVEPQGLEQLVYSIRPTAIGSISLLVEGSASIFSDALLTNLLVEAPGVREGKLSSEIVRHAQDQRSTVTFPMTIPNDAIDGSVKAFLTITGDILGAPMSNLASLLTMPTGCGEQNMIGFAPDVFITNYLEKTHQLKPEIQQQALLMMRTGYQRELTFVHNDGSFSAFGEQDSQGSIWLTAFVLKSFSQAQSLIFIDSKVLGDAANWIISHQTSSGAFEQVGEVIHTSDLMGGEKGSLALTAFVAISLLEYDASAEGAKKAVAYLETKVGTAKNDLYSAAIVCYALVLAKSSQAQDMVDFLMNKITLSDDGSTAYWSTSEVTSGSSMMIGRPCWYCPEAPSNLDIETTGYGLLALAAFSQNPDLMLKISKWLVQQRNPSGGFLSTQDTCVGLQALTAFVEKTFSDDFQLSLILTSTGDRAFSKEVQIDASNFDLLQTVEVPAQGELQVSIEGKGTVVLQSELRYNHLVTDADQNSFVLDVNWTPISEDLAEAKACFTSSIPNQPGMVLLEVGIPTGHLTVQSNLDQLKGEHQEVKRIEVQDTKVAIYLSGLLSDQEYCYTLQSQRIFLAESLQNPLVSVFAYYSPELRATRALIVSSADGGNPDQGSGDGKGEATQAPGNGENEGTPGVEHGGSEGSENGASGKEKEGSRALAASLGVCLSIVALVAAVLALVAWRRRRRTRRGVILRGSFENIPLEVRE